MDLRNLALAFAGGVVVAHWLPALHALWPCLLLAGAGFLPVRSARLLGGALFGLGWGAWHATGSIDGRLGGGCEDAAMVARVAGLPSTLALPHAPGRGGAAAEAGVLRRFEVDVESASCAIGGRLRLSWFDGPPVLGGERWRLAVRLKEYRGLANEHGFDGDRWFARSGLAATGHVVAGTRLGEASGVDAAREAIRQRLGALPLVNGGIVAALTLGDGAAIPRQRVALFKRTGTMHLLVISGLHVGIVTALGFWLGRRAALLLGGSAHIGGVVLALAFAAVYVLLAGGGLSLLRAFTMASVALLALAAGRSTSASAVFAYALAVVLLLDPMAPLAAGFWLSFGAVAVLLGVFAPRARPRSPVLSAVFAQLAIAVVFVPATVGITGLVHPLGVGVNLVVVPVVTLLVVPLALAGVAFVGSWFGGVLLLGADFCLSVVVAVLEVADRVAPLYVPDRGLALLWLVAAGAACLLPLSRLALVALVAALGALLVGPFVAPKRPLVAFGEVAVTVLDVGQGTSVLVETAGRRLVYDAGPGFAGGADSGEQVVLPALRAAARRGVDVLMLSHGDLDHVGGAQAVLRGTDVRRVLAGEPLREIDAAPCVAGMAWRWDGVVFRVLSPTVRERWRGNDASCVLLVQTASTRVLLAGDIEREAENRLRLAQWFAQTPPVESGAQKAQALPAYRAPQVDVLLVPHHGSATSSSAPFVAAARPRFAVVGAGHANRFGHPHPDVVERYQDVGSHIVSTAVSGAIRWHSATPWRIRAARCRGSPYWRTGGRRDGPGSLLGTLVPCG